MQGFELPSFCVHDLPRTASTLIVVRLGLAAVFSPAIRQDAQHAHAVFGKERQNPVVQQVGPGDRRLGRVQLGKGDLAVGIDKGLLVDTSHGAKNLDDD